jgi:hypothetical protein
MKSVHVNKYRYRRTVATHAITNEVPEEGVLLASRYSGRRHLIQVSDEAIGDDQYVFLSVEEEYPSKLAHGDVYVFDAEDLVRKGALLRTRDIATYPAWERLRKSILRNIPWGDEALLSRRKAIMGTVERIPEAKRLWTYLMRKRDETTLRGSAAIDYLRHPEWWDEYHPPEILVPRELALSQSLGVHIRGEDR